MNLHRGMRHLTTMEEAGVCECYLAYIRRRKYGFSYNIKEMLPLGSWRKWIYVIGNVGFGLRTAGVQLC
jgi:hypothetical protein